MPEVRVVLHDMPQDRAVTDRHHRLRDGVVVLPQAHPQATAEQDHLHGAAPHGFEFAHRGSIYCTPYPGVGGVSRTVSARSREPAGEREWNTLCQNCDTPRIVILARTFPPPPCTSRASRRVPAGA